MLSQALKFVATASAVSGVPSVNLTPSLIWKVYVLPSSDFFHEVVR